MSDLIKTARASMHPTPEKKQGGLWIVYGWALFVIVCAFVDIAL